MGSDGRYTNNLKKQHSASLVDYLKVIPQYLIPKHALSRLVYGITRCKWTPLKNFLIKFFIVWFKVDISLAKEPDSTAYKHFNDFFTRELRPGVRPITVDKNIIISPVDGSISQIGKINSAEIFQAKGRLYYLDILLGGDKDITENFIDGQFATLYLSPRDYHRIHMPLDGKLSKMIFVPGKLFSVNTHTTRVVNRLFARNERIITLFDTEIGPMAIIMVGAMNVGSMETVWAGEITPARERKIITIDYPDQQTQLKRGIEMGRFNMGSTVIVLFGRDRMRWLPHMQSDQLITMGMPLGQIQIK
jgi:phosphatidylserine decarboxylase